MFRSILIQGMLLILFAVFVVGCTESIRASKDTVQQTTSASEQAEIDTPLGE